MNTSQKQVIPFNISNQLIHETLKAILIKVTHESFIFSIWIPKSLIRNNWKIENYIDIPHSFYTIKLKEAIEIEKRKRYDEEVY